LRAGLTSDAVDVDVLVDRELVRTEEVVAGQNDDLVAVLDRRILDRHLKVTRIALRAGRGRPVAARLGVARGGARRGSSNAAHD
jgi:hypothetical protein